MDKVNIEEDIKKYNELINRLNLPYEINLFDEADVDENAHSRILMKILAYKKDANSYPFLDDFIVNFLEIKDFVFDCPMFTCDASDRIDLLIKDNSKAIIIENKINYAPDQDQQIKRYFENIIESGIKEDNIHVLYLKDGTEPENIDDDTKKRLSNRLHCKSYKYDILPWLKNLSIPMKEEFLSNSIQEYINYLDKRYGFNKYNIYTMNAINEVLKDASLSYLGEYLKDVVDYKRIIDQIRNEKIYNFFQDVYNELDNQINEYFNCIGIESNINLQKRTFDNSYPRVGLKFKFRDKEFACIIEKRLGESFYTEDPYIVFWAKDKIINKEIYDFLNRCEISKVKGFSNFKITNHEENRWFYSKEMRFDFNEIKNELLVLLSHVSKHIELLENKE